MTEYFDLVASDSAGSLPALWSGGGATPGSQAAGRAGQPVRPRRSGQAGGEDPEGAEYYTLTPNSRASEATEDHPPGGAAAGRRRRRSPEAAVLWSSRGGSQGGDGPLGRAIGAENHPGQCPEPGHGASLGGPPTGVSAELSTSSLRSARPQRLGTEEREQLEVDAKRREVRLAMERNRRLMPRAISGPLLASKSVERLTVPREFSLSVSSRGSARERSSDSESSTHSSDWPKRLRSATPRRPWRPQLTVPEQPDLRTSQRSLMPRVRSKSRDFLHRSLSEAPAEFRSLRERTRDFESGRSDPATPNWKAKVTVPAAPDLATEGRAFSRSREGSVCSSRGSTRSVPPSCASTPFRARPFSARIKAGVVGVPTVPKRVATTPREPVLATEGRAHVLRLSRSVERLNLSRDSSRSLPPYRPDDEELCTPFRARPFSARIKAGVTGVPVVAKRTSTKPMEFNITRGRSCSRDRSASRCEQAQEDESISRSLFKDATFSANSSQQYRCALRQEKSVEDTQAPSFRARPVNQGMLAGPLFLPMKSVVDLTTAVGPNLRTSQRSVERRHRSKSRENMDANSINVSRQMQGTFETWPTLDKPLPPVLTAEERREKKQLLMKKAAGGS